MFYNWSFFFAATDEFCFFSELKFTHLTQKIELMLYSVTVKLFYFFALFVLVVLVFLFFVFLF